MKELTEKYAPQLGEIAWHQFTADPRVHSQSVERFNEIKEIIQTNSIVPKKIFELCPNDRYTAHFLSDQYDCEAYLLDISRRALESGAESAKTLGLKTKYVAVATDFHELPFEDELFDIVYVHQSLHHTNSPALVIQELLRVLKVDGFLLIRDEPVRRGNCLHLFPSNRFESLSPYESDLFNRGLLAYLSHPTGGARPEAIFGMIENQKISLDTYTKALSESCDIVSIKYNPGGDEWQYATKFDKRIWAMFSATGSISGELIFSLLKNEFDEARKSYSSSSELMGLRHPTDLELVDLADRIYESYSRIHSLANSEEQRKAIFETFGGEVSILAHKTKSENTVTDRKASVPSFPTYGLNQILYQKLIYNNRYIDLEHPSLPNIQEGDIGSLVKLFDESDWSMVMDPCEIRSVINLTSSPEIHFPCVPAHKAGVLLFRYYAIAEADPYQVSFYLNDEQIATDWICMSETRFLKHICMESPRSLSVRIMDLQGRDIDLPGHIRVGYLQYFLFSKVEA